jgi:serine/threonine protein phosphatase 1
MKTFAIGDLHGHFDQFLLLYQQLLDSGMEPKNDILVFLGDYIDGGHQSKQMVQWLMDMKQRYPHWQMLYGNHEDLMLDALVYNGRIYGSWDLWYSQGGKATAESYMPEGLTKYEKAIIQVKDVIMPEHLDFLRQLPTYYEDGNYFYVHAGLVPGILIEEHKKILDEGGKRADEFKQNMLWVRRSFFNSQYEWEKKVIFGHTAFKKPFTMSNKIGIDCMNHDVGTLVAVLLPEERFFMQSS